MIYCATISVVAMCIGSVILSYVCLYINSYFTKRLVNMTIWQQLMDYTPLFLLAFVTTWLPAYFITQLPILPIAQLAIGGISSAILYFLILFISKNESLKETLQLLQPRVPTQRLKYVIQFFIKKLNNGQET